MSESCIMEGGKEKMERKNRKKNKRKKEGDRKEISARGAQVRPEA